MRLQSELDELGVFRIVIVLFRLDARVRDVIDSHVQPELFAFRLNHASQVQHGKLLGELVEDAELSLGGGIQAGNLNATHGVTNVEEAAGLSAFAINGERSSDGGLDAETIQHS